MCGSRYCSFIWSKWWDIKSKIKTIYCRRFECLCPNNLEFSSASQVVSLLRSPTLWSDQTPWWIKMWQGKNKSGSIIERWCFLTGMKQVGVVWIWNALLWCSSHIFCNHTNGRVLNEKLYAHGIQKLIFLHIFTELFRKEFSSLVRINCSYFVPNTHPWHYFICII